MEKNITQENSFEKPRTIFQKKKKNSRAFSMFQCSVHINSGRAHHQNGCRWNEIAAKKVNVRNSCAPTELNSEFHLVESSVSEHFCAEFALCPNQIEIWISIWRHSAYLLKPLFRNNNRNFQWLLHFHWDVQYICSLLCNVHIFYMNA